MSDKPFSPLVHPFDHNHPYKYRVEGPIKIKGVKPTAILELRQNKNGRINSPTADEAAKIYLPPLSSARTKLMQSSIKADNLIVLDDSYSHFMSIREDKILNDRQNVIQSLPISANACRELFQTILMHISYKYPYQFEIWNEKNEYKIYNNITKKSFYINDIEEAKAEDLLAILGQLVLEDFNILQLDSTNTNYNLTASLTVFPVGWWLKDRIGYDLIKLHGPAPNWQINEQFRKAYKKKFDNIHDLIEYRSNIFILNTSELFLPEHHIKVPSYEDIGETPDFMYENIFLRREAQSFIRLPKTNCIVFGVRTYISPITSLSYDDLKWLIKYIENWEGRAASYHRKDIWCPVFNKYISSLDKSSIN